MVRKCFLTQLLALFSLYLFCQGLLLGHLDGGTGCGEIFDGIGRHTSNECSDGGIGCRLLIMELLGPSPNGLGLEGMHYDC